MKIVTNEQSNNNLLNRVSSIVSNKLDTENNKKCIIGNINTSNGYSNGSNTTLNLSKPGKLAVSNNTTTTTSGGSNDGQTTGILTIGDLDKNGTGNFIVTSSTYGGGTYSTTT